jgi:hypothetical protein
MTMERIIHLALHQQSKPSAMLPHIDFRPPHYREQAHHVRKLRVPYFALRLERSFCFIIFKTKYGVWEKIVPSRWKVQNHF